MQKSLPCAGAPAQYVASQQVDILEGFESTDNDVFDIIIASDNYNSAAKVVCLDPRALNNTDGYIIPDSACKSVDLLAIGMAQEIIRTRTERMLYPTVEPILISSLLSDNFVTKKGMTKSIEQRMFAFIGRWQRSGLKQTAWCKKNDIKYATFHYWYKRYRNKMIDTDTPVNSPGFVQVMMDSPEPARIQCELAWPDGKRLTFHQPVSADFLKSLIA